jgi:hypothetical protein
VSGPTRIWYAAGDSEEAIKTGENGGAAIPALSKRPGLNCSGCRNFRIPSLANIKPTYRRTRTTAPGARVEVNCKSEELVTPAYRALGYTRHIAEKT